MAIRYSQDFFFYHTPLSPHRTCGLLGSFFLCFRTRVKISSGLGLLE